MQYLSGFIVVRCKGFEPLTFWFVAKTGLFIKSYNGGKMKNTFKKCARKEIDRWGDTAREILIPKNLSAWFGMYLPAMPIIFNFGR